MFQLLLRKLGHDTTSGQILPGIDGLRAIAVTMVLVFHIHGFGADSPQVNFLGINFNPWLTTGHLGVDLFFALSGFLLMLPWAKNHYEGRPAPRLSEYFNRRFYRIAPAYYVQLVVLFLVLAPLAVTKFRLDSPLGIFTVLTHFSFTHYLFPMTSAGLGINGALWTLTIEVCFYVALPFVAKYFVGPKAWRAVLLALLVAEIWKYLSFHEMYDVLVWVVTTIVPQMAAYRYDPLVMKMFLANQFPSQAFNFAIGMYFANLFFTVSPAWKKRLSGELGGVGIVVLLAILAFQAWLIIRLNIWQSGLLYVWFIGVALVCAGLLFLSAHSNFFSEKILGAAPLRLLGLMSYSVYLWHFPIIYFTKTYWTPSGLTGLEKFYYLLVVCVTASLVIGYFSYRHVELPFLSAHRKRHAQPA